LPSTQRGSNQSKRRSEIKQEEEEVQRLTVLAIKQALQSAVSRIEGYVKSLEEKVRK
jgi:hypothetical protein